MLTSTSRRGSSAMKRAANARTSRRSLTSHRHARTSRLPVASTTAARARSPRSSAAREQPHARAETGKPLGGRQAEPRGRTGDEDRLAVHRPKIVRVPRTAADPVSGARIARDDRAVENRVEQGAGHSSLYGTRSRIAQERRQRGYCRSSGAVRHAMAGRWRHKYNGRNDDPHPGRAGHPLLSRARTVGNMPDPAPAQLDAAAASRLRRLNLIMSVAVPPAWPLGGPGVRRAHLPDPQPCREERAGLAGLRRRARRRLSDLRRREVVIVVDVGRRRRRGEISVPCGVMRIEEERCPEAVAVDPLEDSCGGGPLV